MADAIQQSLIELLSQTGVAAPEVASVYAESLDSATAQRLVAMLKDVAWTAQPAFVASLKKIVARTPAVPVDATSSPEGALPNLTAKFLHLVHLGAEYTGHSGLSLLDHLLNTCFILEGWGMDPSVCDAGLFHSIYGTETFSIQLIPPGHREDLRAMIGKHAEQLVYCFSVVQRSVLFSEFRQGRVPHWIVSRLSGRRMYLAPKRMEDLLCALAANWLEQRGRMPREMRNQGLADYRALLPALPERARAMVAQAVG